MSVRGVEQLEGQKLDPGLLVKLDRLIEDGAISIGVDWGLRHPEGKTEFKATDGVRSQTDSIVSYGQSRVLAEKALEKLRNPVYTESYNHGREWDEFPLTPDPEVVRVEVVVYNVVVNFVLHNHLNQEEER